MHFRYGCIDSWAPLAWLARCPKGSDAIDVLHGTQIETRPLWFCEAAWPAPFEEGEFDTTDLVAGTGGRLRGRAAVFVSPGNTVDRIVSLETAAELFVSNSLPCLLEVSGAVLDPSYPRYYQDFCTIIAGLTKFKSTVRTSAGEVRLGVNGCVRWEAGRATSSFKAPVRRDFSTFEHYAGFLQVSMSKLVANMSDPARRHPYSLLATTSSGYDSSAVSALARAAGCDETICIQTDRSGESEDGQRVALELGLAPITVARDDWRAMDCPETYFIAADGTAEAVPLAGAQDKLKQRVLLTGYHGDKVWAKDTENLSDDIVRGDSSGLSLSEYRLWIGFVHCPVTFWGVRQIAELNRISNSAAMRPWDVLGDYSRPIARRIAESAGASRDGFGVVKRASAVAFREFLSAPAMKQYLTWLKDNRIEWLKRGRLPPVVNARYEQWSTKIFDSIESTTRRTPVLWRLAPPNALDRPTALRRYAFPWAASEIARRYRRPAGDLANL